MTMQRKTHLMAGMIVLLKASGELVRISHVHQILNNNDPVVIHFYRTDETKGEAKLDEVVELKPPFKMCDELNYLKIRVLEENLTKMRNDQQTAAMNREAMFNR